MAVEQSRCGCSLYLNGSNPGVGQKETCPTRRLLTECYPFNFGESPATGQSPDADQERPVRASLATEGKENIKRRKAWVCDLDMGSFHI
ncbi:hypothetical protein SODALDRAFT_362845 [Sodiomyces alkalinus F11]|uniref:Uncharacterized protein n=1 Tax=Sodiomyces alkalinus (strain CBS 110278 / VKM F-3762 / F11) TaxID=1314773 RepID=A0A3N2PN89_SODAK|nr:hypothetical protein SODALDRAFT_362845 [Sodiomyces alkalinus F11]ROT35988.1 hypothetical protein SODALDRAFT_362845 [Sodiomyces alkalinus F11]